ncbi:MAG: tRNA pseudouridine(38-40) synthase TruA [Parvularculaceae bacterium]
MARFRLEVEYDGGPFVGWQRQDNGPSVQAAIEGAVFAFRQERRDVVGAGRTDAGVHARAMTAHVDLEKPTTTDVLRDALNHHLKPAPIAVLRAREVGDDFHARFSALARSYEYVVVNRRAPLALEAGRAWPVPGALDAEAMHAAAQALVGRHDFSTFRAAQCQARSPVKTLTRISVSRQGEAVVIRTAAPSFLHHQVRSIAGSLVAVGLGRWPVSGVAAALAARDRSACGRTAPAAGLYFVSADYPGDEASAVEERAHERPDESRDR